MIYKFEVGQILEMIHGQKERDYVVNVVRRWIKNESSVQEFLNMNEDHDGDLVEVIERRTKLDAKNVEHDLYLCKKLKTQEYSLFGRTGLRKYGAIK